MKTTCSFPHLSLRKLLIASLFFFCFKTHAQLSSIGIHFDGDYDFVQGFAGFQIGNSDFTYESWIRSEREYWAIQNEMPFSISDSPNTGFRVFLFDGQVGTSLGEFPTEQTNYFAGPDLRDSACHHIAFTRKGDTTRVYVDGNLASTEVHPVAYIGITNSLCIGTSASTPALYHFKGLIKEVRLWLSARTQSQIQANMNVVLNPATNPTLVAYWRCNEGTGQIVHDIAGNSGANFGNYLSAETEDPYWDYGCPACTGPYATITANGPLTFCSGGNVDLKTGYSINKSYQWLKDNVNIGGATSNKYKATTSGKYKVVVTDLITGCYKLTGTATTVTANPLPAATVTPAGPVSFCVGDSIVLKANTLSGAAYQWKKGGTLIASATKKTYKAKSAGNYRVIVTDTNGCSATSSLVAVSTPCRNNLDINDDNVKFLNVYPNPAQNEINITSQQNVTVQLYDAMSKLLIEKNIERGQSSIDISAIANGIYIMKVTSGKMNKMIKVVVNR